MRGEYEFEGGEYTEVQYIFIGIEVVKSWCLFVVLGVVEGY